MHITVSDRTRSEYGSILKSNSNGTDYVLSLEGVNRNDIGYVDFEKMHGLEGVALANVVSNLNEAKNGARKKLKTKITHNDGATWSFIKPPQRDSNGDSYDCSGSLDECSLNLHGYTEREDYRDSYSSDSAVGLMIAVGNVGKSLTDKKDGNTFLTRDGGITWKEIRKGAFMWEFGDSGSIITIVNGHDSTNVLYYSLNEGASWNEYKFSDDLVKVDDIATVPSDTSRKFVLFGRPPAKEGAKSFAIQVDFTGLTDRKCVLDSGDANKDDFELWAPSHPDLKESCLFGHEALYHRKIPDRDCYIGWAPDRDIMKPHQVIRNCTCSRQDFECDFNYYAANDGTCQLVPGFSPPDHKAVCTEMPGTIEYWEPTGYRRVPLSTCDGGSEFDRVVSHPCPGEEDRYDRKHGGLGGFALFVVVMLPIGMALVIGYIVWDHFQKRYGQIRLGAEDDDQPAVLRYAVISVAAVIAFVSVIPTFAKAAFENITSRLSGSRQGIRFTTRSSLSRNNQRYSPVDIEESGELLGEDDDDILDDEELDQEL
ncbi:Pep1p [Sugiyamaella lignohabitans]|uniref:Pep1p n=1 Tax=Sugiyamaella lignohabitans TaxID=796027 RepID=A0A167DIS0_9ASCO|nr:Pep1p [Sugiyamaella lignohabitans]ANB12962.1 Pep1p [Sugiyamaella lignohabitans]